MSKLKHENMKKSDQPSHWSAIRNQLWTSLFDTNIKPSTGSISTDRGHANVEFRCKNGEKAFAHTPMLSNSSCILQNMFSDASNMEDDVDDNSGRFIVVLPNIDAKTVKYFIQLIYTGEILLNGQAEYDEIEYFLGDILNFDIDAVEVTIKETNVGENDKAINEDNKITGKGAGLQQTTSSLSGEGGDGLVDEWGQALKGNRTRKSKIKSSATSKQTSRYNNRQVSEGNSADKDTDNEESQPSDGYVSFYDQDGDDDDDSDPNLLVQNSVVTDKRRLLSSAVNMLDLSKLILKAWEEKKPVNFLSPKKGLDHTKGVWINTKTTSNRQKANSAIISLSKEMQEALEENIKKTQNAGSNIGGDNIDGEEEESVYYSSEEEVDDDEVKDVQPENSGTVKCPECEEPVSCVDDLFKHSTYIHYRSQCVRFANKLITDNGKCLECKVMVKREVFLEHIGVTHQKILEVMTESVKKKYLDFKLQAKEGAEDDIEILEDDNEEGSMKIKDDEKKTLRTNIVKFKCPECSHSYNRLLRLYRHLVDVHYLSQCQQASVKMFVRGKCKSCNVSKENNNTARVRHVGIKHKLVVSLMPKKAKKAFVRMIKSARRQNDEDVPKLTDNGKKSSRKACPECNVEFRDLNAVLSHSAEEHYGEQLLSKYKPMLAKSKKCPICELNLKTFNDSQLKYHMGVKHNRMKLLISNPRLRDAYYSLE